MRTEKIDYHCHLLPAIDDGATDLQESLRIAMALANFGFTTVHCTPHMIKGCYENLPKKVVRTTALMQTLLDNEGIELRLVPGTEHYFDEFLPGLLPDALTAGPSNYMLIEVPFRAGPDVLPSLTSTLATRGVLPLIAHPERCRAFEPISREAGWLGAFSFVLGRHHDPAEEGSVVRELSQGGCRFQGNIGSFAGAYGKEIQQRAVHFLKQGVYSCLGSDAHTSSGLETMLQAGYEVIVAEIGEEQAAGLLAGAFRI